MTPEMISNWMNLGLLLSFMAVCYHCWRLLVQIPDWAASQFDSHLAHALSRDQIGPFLLAICVVYAGIAILFITLDNNIMRAVLLVSQGVIFYNVIFHLIGRFFWSRKLPGWKEHLLLNMPPCVLLIFLATQAHWFSMGMVWQLLFLGIIFNGVVIVAPLLFGASGKARKKNIMPPDWDRF